ncbi:MAG: DUF4349 domain-containing protein [Solirubrobacterales bacterium]
MKVIPFPGGGSASPDESWLAELEAALNGDGEGSVADSWLQLREDVRTLAPPMDPEFERELGQRIAGRSARSAPKQPHRRLGWLRPTAPTLAALSMALAVIAAVLIAAPWRPVNHAAGSSARSSATSARAGHLGPAFGQAENAPVAGAIHAAKSAAAEPSASISAGAAANAPVPSGAAAAPGRVQQLSAAITLTATPSEVQTVADRVSRLAVSDGGFVQSSHVQVQQGSTGEATLMLSLPSAKLSAALAALGQLAPVRAENQSLQDITNTYNAALQRLNDATAERAALLRALSKATTEGQVDSLRARLSQAGGAIARARSALQTVSRQASTAEVEVTVLGDKSAGSEGLTLHRGLHDAGRVLTVTLIVLLIAAAVLVPLSLLIAALSTSRRAWRRYRRERILDAP